jgi:hypothetical protein
MATALLQTELPGVSKNKHVMLLFLIYFFGLLVHGFESVVLFDRFILR